MKRNLKCLLMGVAAIASVPLSAGNPERMGQAGANQLLINPFARNTGMAGANTARVRGLESQFLNIAGTAFTRKTEIMFNRSAWLQGTDIHINAFGLTQGVGETGTLGFGVVAINAGDIEITTEEQPEGELGTYNPTFYNISLSYAKMFSDNIYGGINFKLLSEQIPNAKAQGLAVDAGIQYHTGKYDQIHFGISLKNWGPKMRYVGDGLTRQAGISNADGRSYELTVSNRSAAYELPTLINIGGAYDFYLTKDTTGLLKTHRVTLSMNYNSNSFTYDNGMIGLEYGWKEIIMVRGGMFIENKLFSDARANAYTGPAIGATFELPFTEKKSTIGLDYSYRFTNPFGGTHSFGMRVNL